MAMKVGELQNSITIIRPDDWHLHIREGVQMAQVLAYSARRFGRAIIMPNLSSPVTTVAKVRSYYDSIHVVLSGLGLKHFQPLMTLYLTDSTTPADIREAKASGIVHAVKYYPAGATTNSENGVTDIKRVDGVLDEMQKLGMPLLVHGEVTDPAVDIFDREKVFIEKVLRQIRKKYPGLKIVFEHITTAEAVEYVWHQWDCNYPTAATITAHHLLLNRNALFAGGIRPHHYCMPILKHENHRRALLNAATSGCPAFFLGTDSAPHPKGLKENDCGCAGCYTAYAGTELYAEIFDSVGKLEMLEGFSSHFGPDFYNLPRNTDKISLARTSWEAPKSLPFGDSVVVPFRAGETMQWKMV